MKKRLFLAAIAWAVFLNAVAQTTIEVIPMVGYTFPYTTQLNSSVNYPQTLGRLDGGMNYGLSFQINPNKRLGLEILYNRVGQSAQLYDIHAVPGDAPLYQTQAGINYLMGGMIFHFPISHSAVSLYFGFDLGASFSTPSPNMLSASNANFALGIQGGVNFYLSPKMGIRISTQVLGGHPPVSGYYFGNWGGDPGWFAFLGTGIVQAGFNLSLIIGLGKPQPEIKKREKRHRSRLIPRPFAAPN
jgi:hypothetical protein